MALTVGIKSLRVGAAWRWTFADDGCGEYKGVESPERGGSGRRNVHVVGPCASVKDLFLGRIPDVGETGVGNVDDFEGRVSGEILPDTGDGNAIKGLDDGSIITENLIESCPRVSEKEKKKGFGLDK